MSSRSEVDRFGPDVARSVLARPPRLGATRLVCVDGPAGSGKTTLAAALDRCFRDVLRGPGEPAGPGRVRTIHMDDVYDGWSGLAAGTATVAAGVVEPLRTNRPGRYRRYDWHRAQFAEDEVVEPVDVLLVEGVGSGAMAYDDAISCLVWVDAAPDLRLERGLARDGEALREHWAAWQRQEEELFARERPWERADVVVDGATGSPRRPPSP